MYGAGKMSMPSLGGKVLQTTVRKMSPLSPAIIHTTLQVPGKCLAPLVQTNPSNGIGLLETNAVGSTGVRQKFFAPMQVRNFVQSSRQNQMNQGKGGAQTPLPRLLYIQNPIVWFTNKMDFLHLRSVDPGFTEKEFTRGVRQAVSRVTQLINLNMFDAMKPLFTKSGLLTLRRDVEILWSDELKRNIAMNPQDIQLIIPRKLHFRNVNGKKLCDVDVVFIGLKHLEKRENSPLLFLDIISRFHRNYTEGVVPDWSIAAFKVRKYNIMPTKGG